MRTMMAANVRVLAHYNITHPLGNVLWYHLMDLGTAYRCVTYVRLSFPKVRCCAPASQMLHLLFSLLLKLWTFLNEDSFCFSSTFEEIALQLWILLICSWHLILIDFWRPSAIESVCIEYVNSKTGVNLIATCGSKIHIIVIRSSWNFGWIRKGVLA